MRDEKSMRVVGFDVGKKAVGNEDDDEYAIEGVSNCQLVDPDSLTVPPQQPDLENIVQEDEHHESMPSQQPLVFRADYC